MILGEPAQPPLVPGPNEIIIESPSFDSLCKSKFKRAVERYGWKYEYSVTSQDDTWGTLWRADIYIPTIDGRLGVNRLMCWYSADGSTVQALTAIAQPIERLKTR